MEKSNKTIKRILSLVILVLVIVGAVFTAKAIMNNRPKGEEISYENLIKKIENEEVDRVEIIEKSKNIKVKLRGDAKEFYTNISKEKEFEKSLDEKKNQGFTFEILKTKDGQKMSYTELVKNINENKLEKIEMTANSTSVKVKLVDQEKEYSAKVPNTQAFMEMIQEKLDSGHKFELLQKPEPWFTSFSNTLLKLMPVILIALVIMLIVQMQGGTDKMKIYGTDENISDVKFEDVAGIDEEREELVELVEFLKEPRRFMAMGAKIPKGVLLFGKPGTGKTLVAKAVAGEAGVPFLYMSGSDFTEVFAGLGASRVRKLFEKAKKLEPCIIFIDEIDAIGGKRTTGGGGVEKDSNQTLNQLLIEMDGFEKNESIIVLAATNRPDSLDNALLRPGRFDRQIIIPIPDMKGREDIFKIHSKDKKMSSEIDFKSLAGDTSGLTGAEIANILNEAAIIATRKKHDEILNEDIDEAIKKVLVGLQKTNKVITKNERMLTAYHEAGHAVVSKFLDTQTNVKEISIIPRGFAGGYTMYKNDEEKAYKSKTELFEHMVSLMGGRSAEKLILNDISTGSKNDIQVATNIAKSMVVEYGMSDTLGAMYLEKEQNYEINPYGDQISNEIGIEIKKILDQAEGTAIRILSENVEKLKEIARILLEKETIYEEEFNQYFEN